MNLGVARLEQFIINLLNLLAFKRYSITEEEFAYQIQEIKNIIIKGMTYEEGQFRSPLSREELIALELELNNYIPALVTTYDSLFVLDKPRMVTNVYTGISDIYHVSHIFHDFFNNREIILVKIGNIENGKIIE